MNTKRATILTYIIRARLCTQCAPWWIPRQTLEYTVSHLSTQFLGRWQSNFLLLFDICIRTSLLGIYTTPGRIHPWWWTDWKEHGMRQDCWRVGGVIQTVRTRTSHSLLGPPVVNMVLTLCCTILVSRLPAVSLVFSAKLRFWTLSDLRFHIFLSNLDCTSWLSRTER